MLSNSYGFRNPLGNSLDIDVAWQIDESVLRPQVGIGPQIGHQALDILRNICTLFHP